MRRTLEVTVLAAAFLLCCVAGSSALTLTDLGNQITITDGLPNSTWGGGSPALGIAGEDNETERPPDTYTYQSWDLEGVFYNSTSRTLYFIGGLNYLTGVGSPTQAVHPVGDIFLGDDLVFDLDRNTYGNLSASGNYTLISDYTSTLGTGDIEGAEPWQYRSGGDVEGSGTYEAGQISAEDWASIDLFEAWNDPVVARRDAHYFLEISLAGTGYDFSNYVLSGRTLHLTMECGNDLIHGAVPEPATMVLLGSGLIGLAGLGRKRYSGRKAG